MKDRRSTPRLDVSFDAEWDRGHPAKIANLSEGGCYLDTVGQVMRGEVVGFRVLLPEGDFLYLEGEVRHYAPGTGFGVQFIEMTEEQKASLQKLLSIAAELGPATIEADLVEE